MENEIVETLDTGAEATPEIAAPVSTVQPILTSKPFQCSECGKGLSSKQSLKSHAMKFHPKAQTSATPAAPAEETKAATVAPAPKYRTIVDTFFNR